MNMEVAIHKCTSMPESLYGPALFSILVERIIPTVQGPAWNVALQWFLIMETMTYLFILFVETAIDVESVNWTPFYLLLNTQDLTVKVIVCKWLCTTEYFWLQCCLKNMQYEPINITLPLWKFKHPAIPLAKPVQPVRKAGLLVSHLLLWLQRLTIR